MLNTLYAYNLSVVTIYMIVQKMQGTFIFVADKFIAEYIIVFLLMHINMRTTIFIYMHTHDTRYLFFVNFMNCFFIACIKLEYISKPTVKDSRLLKRNDMLDY